MGTVIAKFCTIVALVAIYGNLGVIAVRFHNAPALLGYAVMGLLLVPFAYFIYVRRQMLYVDRTLLLILAFGMTLIAATLMARDPALAMNPIMTFIVEGLLLYLLVVNVVRDWPTLRQAVWAVLITAAFIGTLCLYQDITKSYDNEFGGLAQRKTDEDAARRGRLFSDRSQGQIGETNRFAQSMLVLLPLAFVVAGFERKLLLKVGAIAVGTLIFLGMLTTYSRGAIVATIAMMGPMLMFRLLRMRTAVVAGVAGFLVIAMITPTFVERIASIGGVQGLWSERSEAQPDNVTKKRMTEMTAALFVFMDHPMLGVGPGHYVPFYSLKYQMDPDVSFKLVNEPRRAHNLYVEMAAETGIVGIAIFLLIVGSLMHQLHSLAKRVQDDHPELAWMAHAFMVGIFGYMVAAVFLHLAFQRYYWLLLALAGAMVHIMQKQVRQTCVAE